MSLDKYQIRWSIVLIVTLIVAALFFWESKNLKIPLNPTLKRRKNKQSP